MDHDPARVRDLDARLVRAAKGIKVLSAIEWPRAVLETFLQRWHAGEPTIPAVASSPADFSESARELEAVAKACDPGHPVEAFLAETARSYLDAVALLGSVGRPAFARHSRAMYGDPGDSVAGDRTTAREAAQHLMDITAPYATDCRLGEDDFCVLPETVADEMRRQAGVFDRDPVEVVVDPALAAKAAAGARRVRLRGATCFTAADVPQLIHHELFVHTLTAINGSVQPGLAALGLGAPRTTRTQEGLALFAELITNSFDVNRLRRIAARVVAIDMALRGADFVEVFRYFLDNGQTEPEAAASAARVFRGGDPNGGVPFTKDAVYFQGLVRVHRFLKEAIRDHRLHDPERLMAGRMCTDDVARLAPFFESGALAPPRYVPDWVRNRSRLVAFLVYASFAEELHLDPLLDRRG